MAVVVAVLNMKGGVGKTTIAAHVMRVLYLEHQKKVLLVDFDPQFNLTQTVIHPVAYEKLKAKHSTIYAAMEPPSDVGLLDVIATDHAPPATSELVVRLKQTIDGGAFLDLVPGDFSLVKYSVIDDHVKLAKVSKRFQRFIAEAKKTYDLIVLDCNPSSSFITMCALMVSNNVLVPIRPDKYSSLGLEMLYDYVNQLPQIHPKPVFNVLLNAIPRSNYNPAVEDDLRAHGTFGPRVLVNKIYQSTILAASPAFTGFATDKKVPHRWRVSANISSVAAELAGAWNL